MTAPSSLTTTTAPGRGRLRRALAFVVRKRGDRRWDGVIWGTGIVGLAGFPVLAYFPDALPMVWFALLSIVANSPLSPIFPASFEPLIMEASKYAPALTVTLVGLVMYMYTEFFNYHIYAWVLGRERLAGFREHRLVKRSVAFFARSPVATVIVFAFTPLPFWVVRIMAILDRMSFRSFMIATAVGRFPRIFFYAWLGHKLKLSAWLLAAVALGTAALVVLWRLVRRKPILEDTVMSSDAAKSSEPEGDEPAGA